MNNLRRTSPIFALLLATLLTACSSVPWVKPVICSSAQASPMTLLGEMRWPRDWQFAGTTVGGLSSIDYDSSSGLYYLVSDDRSTLNPAHIYTALIRYDVAGLHEFKLQNTLPLRNAKQQLFASGRTPEAGIPIPDAEALRVLPGGQAMLWSSEGDFARGFGPQLIQATIDGHWQRDWPLPPGHALSQQAGQGPRSNFTLEGLALSDDRKTLWASMEAPLLQDGPMPAPGKTGGALRITAYDMATQQPIRQLPYVPDALPSNLWIERQTLNGVSEILADGPDHLLVLERSFAPPLNFGARIYRVSTRPDAGTDTLNLPQLTPSNHQPLQKTLLVDLADAGLRSLDNIEGMTWGPSLPDGRRVLLLVSDNNFNPAETTQLIALRQESGSCARGL